MLETKTRGAQAMAVFRLKRGQTGTAAIGGNHSDSTPKINFSSPVIVDHCCQIEGKHPADCDKEKNRPEKGM